MVNKRRLFFNFFAGFVFLLSIILGIFFAPIQLGGLNEYILINGNSMEPTIQQGDLIIVRKTDQYRIGDAVAYLNPDLQKVVFHRIVGLTLDRFNFQGDNNTWIDSYKPSLNELIGKQWIQIPIAGKIGNWMRNPLIFALINGGLGGLFLSIVFHRSSKKTPSTKLGPFTKIKAWINKIRDGATHAVFTNSTSSITSNNPYSASDESIFEPILKTKEINGVIEISFFVLGLLAIVSLGTGIFAFSAPLNHIASQDNFFSQVGAYSYNAATPVGVYDSQMINSGDPIFTKLICKMNLMFIYVIVGDGLRNLTGTHQLAAVISDPVSGWARTIPLEEKQSFTRENFTSQVQVDLCQLQAITKEMEIQTGTTPGTFLLNIIPNVSITGQIKKADLKETFTAPLSFNLDTLRVYMVKANPLIDPLNPFIDGTVKSEFIEPNSLNIFSTKFPVASTRIISVLCFLISLFGLAVLLTLISRTSRGSSELQVRMKHGSSMVDVKSSETTPSRPTVDVMNIDDLARLAERNNTVILHETRGRQHTYLVEADQVKYRFILNEVLNNTKNDGRQENRISAFNLQQGIVKNEFIIHYQPIISILDQQIMAVEALLCWQHPQNGLLSARNFINEAETTGLIDVLGKWVLHDSSLQVREWQKERFPLRLAVNFSRSQIEKHPAQLINQVLNQTGMSIYALQVEISETSLLKNPESILSNLMELKQMGAHLTIDGYTGDSLLKSLKELPFESIKIDRSLIMKLNQPQGANRVLGIISAALNRGLKVVAEGVETDFQMNMLRSQFCSQAQGFLIAYPAPADKISAFLAHRDVTQVYSQ